MCDHIWVKRVSGSKWGSNFLIVNDLAKAFAVNSAALYIKIGRPGCEVGVPRVPTLSVSKVPRRPFWKYWLIICKFFEWLHHNPHCAVCRSHTFPQNMRLLFLPLCYQSKLKRHWPIFPLQTSLQLLSATKTHVKHLTKMSVPQCENEKKVITGRCCFPRFKFVKVSHGPTFPLDCRKHSALSKIFWVLSFRGFFNLCFLDSNCFSS